IGLGTTFLNFGAIVVDPGASWHLAGVTANPLVTNNGTVIVDFSALLAVGDVNGSGVVNVLNNGTAVFNSTVGAGQTLVLSGPGSKIDLTDFSGNYLQGFSGTISGLAVSSPGAMPVNAVELAGVAFSGSTSATVSGNMITVMQGSTTVATLNLAAAFTPGTVLAAVQADPNGGTDVFLVAVPPPSPTNIFDFIYTYADGR